MPGGPWRAWAPAACNSNLFLNIPFIDFFFIRSPFPTSLMTFLGRNFQNKLTYSNLCLRVHAWGKHTEISSPFFYHLHFSFCQIRGLQRWSRWPLQGLICYDFNIKLKLPQDNFLAQMLCHVLELKQNFNCNNAKDAGRYWRRPLPFSKIFMLYLPGVLLACAGMASAEEVTFPR